MPIEPEIAEVIRTAIASDRLELHTALPAVVVSYDEATQTATVKPSVRVTVPAGRDGFEYDDVPEIQDVPVAWARGGGASLQFPLATGDHVFLVFSEADMGQFRDTGQESNPSDVTRHDWSYPVAFPVMAPRAGSLRQVSGPHLECSGLTVGGDPAGMNFVALANLVLDELNAINSDISNLKTAIGTGFTAVGNSPAASGPAGKAAFDTAASALPTARSAVASSVLKTE